MRNPNVLVDGANGYVGSNWVSAALEGGNHERVVALVRGGRSRLDPALEKAVIAPGSDADALECYDYDLTQPSMGLDGDALDGIFDEPCDYWHVAASIDLRGADIESLATTNIVGTQRAIETFCSHAQPGSRFFHIGTVYSRGSTDEAISEQWHTSDPEDRFRTEYERTKRAAEQLIREASEDPQYDHLSWAVLRLGQVAGMSDTGATTTKAGIYDLTRAVARLARSKAGERLRIVAHPSARLALVPIDACVSWMAAVADAERWPEPAIFNLVDRQEVAIDDFFLSLSKHTGVSVERADAGEISEPPPSALEQLIGQRIEYSGRYIKEIINISRTNLDHLVGPRSWVDEALVDRLLSRYVADLSASAL